MTEPQYVQCCIAGGGPAGMMLGYLMGRAGVETVVLEKHGDFLRDFRGDTVHPSTLDIMSELGLIEDFLKHPHSEIREIAVEIGQDHIKVADFTRIPGQNKFMATMPQWDFLNFLAENAKRYPRLKILMQAEVTDLIEDGGRVIGVTAKTPEGPLSVRADVVIGCDGRSSTVRAKAGLDVQDLGAPIDVLWFRLSKKPGDPQTVLGRLSPGKMIVTIDRCEYWQCAYVIQKGGFQKVQADGLLAFKASLAEGAKFLADRVDELTSFEDIKLLSVSVDRLTKWSRPGLLCIGDAAHAMSPVGGVGVNLAIQDAVATANLLSAKLKTGTLKDADLDAVRRRRLFPVQVIQAAQILVHNTIFKPNLAGARPTIKAPWPVKLLNRNAWLRRWPAELIGLGVRRENVRSPSA